MRNDVYRNSVDNQPAMNSLPHLKIKYESTHLSRNKQTIDLK